jgi:hypothetical protein
VAAHAAQLVRMDPISMRTTFQVSAELAHVETQVRRIFNQIRVLERVLVRK